MTPFTVKAFRRSGSGDIAERISSGNGLVPVAVRARFSGGTGDADLTISAIDGATGNTVCVLHTVPDCGTDGEANLNLVFSDDEVRLGAWTVLPGEILAIAWTNPASGTMTWELEVRYQDAS